MEPAPDTQPGTAPPADLLTADALLDTLPWGVLVLDEQRLIRQVNQQAARWCDAGPGAALPPALDAALPRLLASGEAVPHKVFLPGPAQWLSFTARRQPGGWVLYGQQVTTQQREQQQAPAASEDWFRTVVNLVPDLLWRSTPDSNTTWYNQRWYEYTGQTPTAAADYGWTEVIHPDDRAESSRRYQAAVAAGQPLRQEHRIRSAQGEYRWFQVQAQPLRNEHGQVTDWLGAATDIHARVLAEQHLHAAAAAADAFRLALADALAPLTDPVAVQEAGTYLARRHFGADRCYYGEIENGQVIIRCDAAADGLPSVAGTYPLAGFALLRAVIEAGRPVRVRDVRQDAALDEGLRALCQQLGAVSCLSVPVVKHGQAAGVLCLVQNAPRTWTDAEAALAAEVAERTWVAVERVRAEADLAASEAKYRALFNSLDEGVCLTEMVYDEAGRVTNYRFVEVNEVFERQTGIAQATGKLATEVAPNLEPAWLQTVDNVARTGVPLRTEAYFQDSGRWYGMSLHRVGGAGSRLVGSIFSDITERRRREANLAFLAEVSEDLTRRTNLNDTINALGEKLATHLSLAACAFVELVDEAQTGIIRHGWHRADMPDLRGTYRMAEFVAPEVLRRSQAGEAVVVRDVWADPLTDGEQYAALHIGSFVSMPLMRDEECRFLLVAYRSDLHDWPDDEIDLLHETAVRIWGRLERTRAKEALYRAQEQFRLFVTASADALYRMDADWRQMRQLNGRGFLADTAAPTASWLEFYIPPADRATVGAAIEAAIAGSHFFELEHRVFRADGSVGWTFSRAAPVLNEFGELVEWFGTATDVTARKQAEQALRERLEQQALFEAVQAAQEAERRQLAERLHNGIGQILYATKLRLEHSRALVPAPTAAAQALRQETDALLSEAIRQTRALSHELVPLVLEEFGLAAALQDIGRKLTAPPLILRSHVALDEAAAPLSPPLQMALYRIAQELALNVVRHAREATEASLELETMPGWVLLRATDNGPGFAATPAASPGLGLRSIRDRVALLGGQLESGNVLTGGAYVRIRLPLPALPAHDTPLPG